MNRKRLNVVVSRWLPSHLRACAELDGAMRGRRGPRLIPSAVFFSGLLYLILAKRAPTIAELAICLQDEASEEELVQLGVERKPGTGGVPTPPSVHQLYRFFEILEKAFRPEADCSNLRVRRVRAWARQLGAPYPALKANQKDTGPWMWSEGQQLLTMVANWVLEGTAPPLRPDAVLASDGTLIPAYMNQFRPGADCDAARRTVERGKGRPEVMHGYQAVDFSVAGPGREYVYGISVAPADRREDLQGTQVVDGLLEGGTRFGRLLVDRGISQHSNFLMHIRGYGISPTFDLKKTQIGPRGEWKGALIVDGWPHTDALPERLRILPPPDLSGPAAEAEKRAWRKAMDERQPYAFQVKEWLSPVAVRVESPLVRYGRLGCKDIPGSMRRSDPSLQICGGGHDAGQGCGLKNATWRAEFARDTFQCPPYGSPGWRDLYNRRTAVERTHNLLKNSDVGGLSPGRLRWRGLPAVTLLLATSFAVINLRLWGLDEAALRAGQANSGRPLRSSRTRVRRSRRNAGLAPDVGSRAGSA